MKILYVASEVAPFVKTGGLGDVAGSLPQALAKNGHEVAVMLPLYAAVNEDFRARMQTVLEGHVQLAWRRQYCGVRMLEEGGVKYYFIDNEYYFKRSEIYGAFDDAERFAFFSKAVLEVLPQIDLKPDVINANDWQSALVPIYYKLLYAADEWYAGIKTVFTIHNIQYQGQFTASILQDVFGLDQRYFDNGLLEFSGGINLMKGALVLTDFITTVSPTYALEIQSAYYAYGLHKILQENSYKLRGILNGIDVDVYNPAKDPHLFENYSVRNFTRKKQNKEELMRLLGMKADDSVPVVAIISRLVAHKGIDLVEGVLDELLSLDLRLVVVGTGEWRYEQLFKNAQERYPGKISANILFSPDLASKVYAGADIFLMPSQSEPCGLSQMIAMRYGTIPIVRETGGLKDTVLAYTPENELSNGFSFTNYNAHDMLHVVEQACAMYKNDPKEWKKLVKKGLTADFSWSKSALAYIDVYTALTGEN